MKKIILLVMVISFALIGCDQDVLNYFQEAAEKTDRIDRGKSTLNLEAEVEFSDLLIEEAVEVVDLLGQISYTSDKEFDNSSNERLVRQYLGTKVFGFDTIYYNDKGFEYIKVPFVGKYIKLENLFVFDGFDENAFSEPPVSQMTIDAIEDAWYALIEEDDVVNLGNEVIDTPEGEVKVKKMVVTFSNEQVKTFLNKALDLVSEDETFRREIFNYPVFVVEDGKMRLDEMPEGLEVDMMVDSMRTFVDDIVVEDFKMESYIDLDQYIIETRYNIHISFVDQIKKYIKSIRLNAEYQMYDLHQPMTFEFPKVDPSNTTTLNEVLNTLEVEIPLEN